MNLVNFKEICKKKNKKRGGVALDLFNRKSLIKSNKGTFVLSGILLLQQKYGHSHCHSCYLHQKEKYNKRSFGH